MPGAADAVFDGGVQVVAAGQFAGIDPGHFAEVSRVSRSFLTMSSFSGDGI